jgi:DNA replication protein DnaC
MTMKKISNIAFQTSASSHEVASIPNSTSNGDCSADCPDCGGVGYFGYDVPVGHPKFGKLERCQRAQTRAIERYLQSGDIDPRIGLSVDELRHLSWDMVRKGVNQADRACEVTRKAYGSGHGLVFLYGGFGQGKSLILKIAAAMAVNQGKRAAYANLAGVLDDIRSAYDERENKMTELVRRMEWWTSLDVLAIDELDKVGQTDWAKERIFQLLDARYQRAVRQEALTVIAANHQSLDDLSGYLRSRIEDNRFAANGYVINLKGTDGRKSMPLSWKY